MFKIFCIFLCLNLYSSILFASNIVDVKNSIEKKDFVQALKLINENTTLDKNEDLQIWAFAKGYVNYQLQDYDQSIMSFQNLTLNDFPLNYYSQYYLGHSYQAKAMYSEALAQYLKILKLAPPSDLKYQTRFRLSEVYLLKNQWRSAFNELNYLERRWRADENYPEVLWRLIKVELKLNRKWKACKWARKLYVKFPQHPLVDDWNIDLPNAPFEGQKLGCLVTTKDQEKRIKRLQWAGKSDRARSEIEVLKSRVVGEAPQYLVDKLLSQFLISEGFAEEALQILVKYYKKESNDFNYLNLLGKAASRAGEYQTAVGAYYKAHQLNKKSRYGREALFQAAFLSYQFQDYDGASRKFEEFVKRYPNSGLSRDSKWHLSWIKYLKGDYKGAIKDFDRILSYKLKRREKRYWRKFSTEKINYWKAMALYRLDNLEDAKTIFNKLSLDQMVDFYGLLAKERLESPKFKDERTISSVAKAASNNQSKPLAELQDDEVPSAELSNEKVLANQEGEETESEDSLKITQDEDSEADSDEEETVVTSEEDESSKVTEFKDPQLRSRFERANLLSKIGINEWSKWELYEIERKTRNKDYLKMLMSAYDQLGAYHRSSYISVIYFSDSREKFGIDGVRYLWEFAYPKAYGDSVKKISELTSVPSEFIFSIIRAESSFRPDVVSPVGAKGLMQLMPNTARQMARLTNDVSFAEKDLFQPSTNVRLGSSYLKRLLTKFDNSIPLAAAAYNAGPHRVENWLANFGDLQVDEFIEHIPFVETRNYVKKVSRNFFVYSKLYGNKKELDPWLTKPIHVQITRPSSRETWEAL